MDSNVHRVTVSGDGNSHDIELPPVRSILVKQEPYGVYVAINYNRAPNSIWLSMTGTEKGTGAFLTIDEAEEIALAILIRVKELRDEST